MKTRQDLAWNVLSTDSVFERGELEAQGQP